MAAVKTTAAFASLQKNLTRARYFLEIHGKAQTGRGAPTRPYQELPRASLVFAIAALDSYISEATAEFLVGVFASGINKAPDPDRARRVLGRVQKEIPTLPLELALVDSAKERKELAHTAIVAYFYASVSNHGAKAVAEAIITFDAAANVKGFWDSVERGPVFVALRQRLETRIQRDRAARHGRAAAAPKQFPALKPAQLLDFWTDVRHAMVHRGEDKSVWRAEAESCCDLVMVVGTHLDALALA